MNKGRIIDLAKNIFPDIKAISDSTDVYRGELKISEKSAGIYYLDVSGNITLEKFNDYQEDLLADEYYNHPGNLQWNLYLLLLQDEINPKIKEEIENNKKYARKYVFTETQFEDFFKIEKSDAVVSSDIVLQWKESLKKVDLQELYTKAKYTEAVERFVNDQTKKITISETQSEPTDAIKINFIDNITLKEGYREYPKEPRFFKFGKVNLIKGINGVGKTCLLESIELVACGKTFRNPGKKEGDNCIEARLNNSKQLEYCTPSNNTKYRQRDAYWYSNNYVKDNFVFSSFNRFNFFNTDAANDLANSNNEDDVKNALSNIILGSEFNYISERITGFLDRIKPIYYELDRGIKGSEQTIKETEIIIARASLSTSINTLVTVLKSNILELRFKNKAFDPDKNIAEIEITINQLRSIIEKAVEQHGSLINSKNDLNNSKIALQQKQNLFNDFKSTFEKITKDVSATEEQIKGLESKLNLLQSANKYFADSIFFEIKGLAHRIENVENSIKRIEALKRILGSLDLKKFFSEEHLKDLITKASNDLNSSKIDLSELETELKSILAQLGDVNKIINEIKLLGKEYLKLLPEADFCPLCQTSYKHTELEKRIEEALQANSKESQSKIDLLYQKQQSIKENIEKKTQYQNNLTTIKTAHESAFGNLLDSKSLTEIFNEISVFIKEEADLEQQKSQLAGFRQIAQLHNLSENEFITLSDKLLKEVGEKFELLSGNKKIFQENIAQFLSDIEKLKETLIKDQEQRFKISHDFKKSIGLDENKTYTLSEFGSLIETEKKALNLLETYYQEILQILDLNNETLLLEIDIKLSALQKNIISYKTEQQSQFELNQAEKNKKEAQVYLNLNLKKFDRIKKAFELLQVLAQSDGNEQLNSFFDANLKEIIDIFKTIHSPKEFKSLVYQNKQLSLIKENDQKYKVTEISTGQRGALALSIFISLNRQLKNGPNVMIFDDPVSHIDDLNALSFLDFLRFFILKENRQIFFATANARLASLFEKKFEFLESDFQKWELKR